MTTPLVPPAVLAAYGWQEWACTATPCGNGHINRTLSLRLTPPAALSAGVFPLAADGTLAVILQRINTAVFSDPARLMDNIDRVTAYLRDHIAREGGDPQREALQVIRTTAGALYTTDEEDGVWRCYAQVTDAVSPPPILTAAQMEEAGRGYGRFLYRLRDYPLAGLHIILPGFHDTPQRLEVLRAAAQRDVCGRAREVEREIAFCLARAADCGRLEQARREGALPLRVTHNDTKLNNLLLDRYTGRCVCVLDLDTVMPGLTAYDFGDAIRSGCTSAAEDEADLDRVHFEPAYYAAYLRGYLETAGPALTPAEQDSLPWGARIMTLECGIRFLTDYLEGDVYFATNRPGHNRDRCRNQLKLVADMEAHFDNMMVLTRTSACK